MDVRQRDVVINQLQSRIYELERGPLSPNNEFNKTASSGSGSTDSSIDIPFVVNN